jgi:hypothetical protein
MGEDGELLMKLGRLPADYSKPRLWLEDYYVDTAMPTPPQNVDRASRVATWPMYKNDVWGCCTIAGIAHMLGAQATYAKGAELTYDDAEIATAYEGVCPGFDPATDANDNGAVMSDVLAYMASTGLMPGTSVADQHKITAYAQLRDMSPANLKLAMYLFGSVYIGVNLPQSAQEQFSRGEPWTYQKGSRIAGGHCVVLQKDTPAFVNEFTAISWGAAVRVQDKWLATYMMEAWVAITPAWFQSNAHTIDAVSLVTLTDDMRAL